jgi:hypothetical protein
LARIFLGLSLFAVLVLGVNIMLGLAIGDFHALSAEQVTAQEHLSTLEKSSQTPRWEIEAEVRRFKLVSQEFQRMKQRKVLHFLTGVAAGLVVVLVNSISVTYFIGTGRWCREVVAAYALSSDYIGRSNAIKRSSFPWSLGGILAILAIVILGAAADPSANIGGSPVWVTVHFASALAGTMFIALSLLMQVRKIAANYEVIDQIVAEVASIRAAKGLDL